jgi:hypothetical protein
MQPLENLQRSSNSPDMHSTPNDLPFPVHHLGSTVTAFRLGAIHPQMAVVETSKSFLTYAFQPSAILHRRRFDAVLALVRL